MASLAGAFAVVDPVRGAGESAARAAAAAWNGVFGERPAASAAQRMIVVLEEPALADLVAMAEEPPTSAEQKRWVSRADAAQRALLGRLAARGIELTRERSFTRTLNGFSTFVDARAQAELERTDGVAGVYPVRTLYPAGITAQTLARAEFRAGAGRRPDPGLRGFDGSGVRIALLDGGVDRDHPYLNGRVLRGIDLVDRDRRADAEPKPDDPERLESHATQTAGILVGSGGPGGLRGVAPGARVLPIRILGWERAADGAYELLGRGDTLLAALERSVDPDGDGDVDDAVTVALAAVVQPFASFSDSPESRAVAGASRLGTLVVAPAGNDGRGGPGFGTVGAPAGAAEAVAVGALDARTEIVEARTTVRVGGETTLDAETRLLGPVPPDGALPAVALLGPSLADPAREPGADADGTTLEDYFDRNGVSRVAGRAVVVPGERGSLEAQVRNAVTAGAAAVLVFGSAPAGASLDLDEASAVPVVAVPPDAGRAAVEGLERGEPVSVSFGGVRRVPNPTYDHVAAFSSGGVAYGGHVKPDLVAAGVGIATADGGTSADGTARYATATGSSAAAAVVAGSAAVLAQARPGLAVDQLRGLLVGSARQLVRDGLPDPVTVQGAGALDLDAAVAAELAVEPVTLAFGRADRGRDWEVTQTVTIHNLSARRLEIGLGVARDRAGGPELSFAAVPARLSLRGQSSADVMLVASGSGQLEGEAAGSFVVAAEGSLPIRVPWAVSFRPEEPEPLLSGVALSHRDFEASDGAPAVLAFRVGAVASGAEGRAIDPVERLDVEIWTAGGRRLGVLTRLHDLLPGRYAFGLTGRGPAGKKLTPGEYVLRLRAHPVAGDADARPTTVDVPFRITGSG